MRYDRITEDDKNDLNNHTARFFMISISQKKLHLWTFLDSHIYFVASNLLYSNYKFYV